ncbi:predicted protein [Postia placenta Mad-698-R]|nr:predicted protein [Postia placenta Mad-698-R]
MIWLIRVLHAVQAKLDEDCDASLHGDSLRFLRLLHPRSGIPALFLPSRDPTYGTTSILEVQAIAPPNRRSWLLPAGEVLSDGQLLLMTPVDPAFLLIPLLRHIVAVDGSSGSFRPMDDLFEEAIAKLAQASNSSDVLEGVGIPRLEDVNYLASFDCVQNSMKRICEVKEIGSDMTVYRYAPDKVLRYLRAKATRLSTQQYASQELYNKLLATYDFTPLDVYLKAFEKENAPSVPEIVKETRAKAKSKISETSGTKRKASANAGVEKLKKANVKGMANISSFFQKPTNARDVTQHVKGLKLRLLALVLSQTFSHNGDASVSLETARSSLRDHSRSSTQFDSAYSHSTDQSDISHSSSSAPSLSGPVRAYSDQLSLGRPSGSNSKKFPSSRVISLPETVSAYSAKAVLERASIRVVSMPLIGVTDSENITLDDADVEKGTTTAEEGYLRTRSQSHVSDMPYTPSPPSSPESVLIIANKDQLAEGFLRGSYNGARTPAPIEDEGWITWAKSPPRPIPALHGPLSLPYARCPSGAEGTIIEEQDNLPRMIWGLEGEDLSSARPRGLGSSTRLRNTPSLWSAKFPYR